MKPYQVVSGVPVIVRRWRRYMAFNALSARAAAASGQASYLAIERRGIDRFAFVVGRAVS